MRFPSIYKIVNKINQKYYVGSSVNPTQRWNNHKRHLCLNKHANDYLQRAWNKYGKDAFDFIIVVSFPSSFSEQQLLSEEQKWLNKAEFDPLTYNLTFVAGSPNSNMSEYSKKKRSESLKRVVRTPEWKAKISRSHMGLHPTPETLQKLRISHLGKKHTPEHIEKATEPRRKHWDFISPTGESIHIYDLKRFCRDNALNSGRMYDVYSGKRNHHKNWKAFPLRQKPKYRPTPEHIRKVADGCAKDYVFLSPQNEKICIHNLAKFCRENNLHSKTMCKVFHGKIVNHRGWRKYAVQ